MYAYGICGYMSACAAHACRWQVTGADRPASLYLRAVVCKYIPKQSYLLRCWQRSIFNSSSCYSLQLGTPAAILMISHCLLVWQLPVAQWSRDTQLLQMLQYCLYLLVSLMLLHNIAMIQNNVAALIILQVHSTILPISS